MIKIAIGAVDAIAARTLEPFTSCSGLWLSSFEIASSLGIADDDQLGIEDLSARVRAITRVSTKPLFIDASNSHRFGHTRLLELAASIDRRVTLVIDDTRYPRVNSFSKHANSILNPSEMATRLLPFLYELRHFPLIEVCIRTEHYVVYHDLPATIKHLQEIIWRLQHRTDQILVHGYDIINNGIDPLHEGLPNQRFVTLATLSPGAFIRDFIHTSISVLIIPSILTIQRFIAGQRLVDEILRSEVTIDGPYKPFTYLIKDMQLGGGS